MVNGIWIDNRKTGNEILDKNRLSTEGVFHFNISPVKCFFSILKPPENFPPLFRAENISAGQRL